MIKWLIKWTVVVAAALLLAGFLLTLFINSDCCCKHEDIDIKTGRLRYTYTLFSYKLSERIEDSALTEVLPPEMLEGSTPEWRRGTTFFRRRLAVITDILDTARRLPKFDP